MPSNPSRNPSALQWLLSHVRLHVLHFYLVSFSYIWLNLVPFGLTPCVSSSLILRPGQGADSTLPTFWVGKLSKESCVSVLVLLFQQMANGQQVNLARTRLVSEWVKFVSLELYISLGSSPLDWPLAGSERLARMKRWGWALWLASALSALSLWPVDAWLR